MLRLDRTEYDAKSGVKYHIFRSKPLKALGSPHEGLTEKELNVIEKDLQFLDKEFNLFISQQRGLTIETIQDLQGKTYFGVEAKDLGLVDEVVTHFSDKTLIQEVIMAESGTSAKELTLEDIPNNLLQSIKQKAQIDERKRISYILNLGANLNIPKKTVQKYIDSGATEDLSKDTFGAIAEALQENTKIIQEQQSVMPQAKPTSLHDVLQMKGNS